MHLDKFLPKKTIFRHTIAASQWKNWESLLSENHPSLKIQILKNKGPKAMIPFENSHTHLLLQQAAIFEVKNSLLWLGGAKTCKKF